MNRVIFFIISLDFEWSYYLFYYEGEAFSCLVLLSFGFDTPTREYIEVHIGIPSCFLPPFFVFAFITDSCIVLSNLVQPLKHSDALCAFKYIHCYNDQSLVLHCICNSELHQRTLPSSLMDYCFKFFIL